MTRFLLATSCLIIAMLSPLTQAQLVTQTTQGIITDASGPLAELIGTDEPVTIEYTFDTTVADMIADPGFGRYMEAVVSLSVSFDNLGLTFEHGNSLLDVLDDFAPFSTTTKTDGIIIYPGDIISTEIIAEAEVELGLFLIEATGAIDEPLTMISSDAIPDYPVDYLLGRLGFSLVSSVESTHFEIGSIPEPLPDAACSEAFDNHGQYVKCVAHDTNSAKKNGTISGKEKGKQQSSAAKSK